MVKLNKLLRGNVFLIKLSSMEAKSIKAGASVGFIVGGIIAGITFLTGILDGYFRPFRCR